MNGFSNDPIFDFLSELDRDALEQNFRAVHSDPQTRVEVTIHDQGAGVTTDIYTGAHSPDPGRKADFVIYGTRFGTSEVQVPGEGGTEWSASETTVALLTSDLNGLTLKTDDELSIASVRHRVVAASTDPLGIHTFVTIRRSDRG